MKKNEQKRFIRELMGNITKDLLAKADRWPEHWDGHELRCLIRDTAALCVMGAMEDKRSRRYKDYENECVNRSLP